MTERGEAPVVLGDALGGVGEQRRVPQDYSGGRHEGCLEMWDWWGPALGFAPEAAEESPGIISGCWVRSRRAAGSM